LSLRRRRLARICSRTSSNTISASVTGLLSLPTSQLEDFSSPIAADHFDPDNFGLSASLEPFVYFALGGALKAFSIAFTKPLRRSHFSRNSLRKLTGKIFQRTGNFLQVSGNSGTLSVSVHFSHTCLMARGRDLLRSLLAS
jgi:hypothetical protein